MINKNKKNLKKRLLKTKAKQTSVDKKHYRHLEKGEDRRSQHFSICMLVKTYKPLFVFFDKLKWLTDWS